MRAPPFACPPNPRRRVRARFTSRLRRQPLHVDAVLAADALPLLKEDGPVEPAVGGDERDEVERVLEVEYFDVVLDGHLDGTLGVGERAGEDEGHHARVALSGHNLRRHRLAERHWRLGHRAKRVLVVLDGEAGEGRGRVVLDGDLLVDAPVLRDKGVADLHALRLVGGQHELAARGGRRGRRRRRAKEVVHPSAHRGRRACG
eukprot:6179367-Pleurochrysis_carterae.AAC.2